MADGNGQEREAAGVRILIVDDDDDLRRGYERILRPLGQVVTAADGAAGAELVAKNSFDVILSDINMPHLSGVEFLRRVREFDLDVPVVLMTGDPALDTAIAAVEYGAFRYLKKPIAIDALTETVRRAITLSRLAKIKREALALTGKSDMALGDRASLEARFSSALAKLWVAYQPIVCWSTRTVYGHEALVRSDEPSLANPMDLLDAAERLDRLHDLGRAVRAKVAAVAAENPTATFFVNLHALDLEDPELYSADAPLGACSDRVVLEITERASLHRARGVVANAAKLRALGYRIAIDDLGAGYAGLSNFSLLEPEIVKLDMSLIRGIDGSTRMQSIVRAMLKLCHSDLGIPLVCEGVETPAERDVLLRERADLFQGYLFAKPGRQLQLPAWG